MATTSKTFVREVAPYRILHRDPVTGLAWVADHSAGVASSCHPNVGGTIANARKLYGRDARLVKCRGFIYNTSSVVGSDEMTEIARQECKCGGSH